VTTAIPQPRAGNYRSTAHGDVVVDAGFVSAHLKSPGVRIIDARDPEFYDGTTQSEMNPRGGHIAGAHSIPFGTLSDSAGHILPDAELRKIFVAAGVSPGDTWSPTATSVSRAPWSGPPPAARLRRPAVRRLVREWSIRSDLPVEGGK